MPRTAQNAEAIVVAAMLSNKSQIRLRERKLANHSRSSSGKAATAFAGTP